MAKRTISTPTRSQEEIDDAAEQGMLAAAMGFTEREIFEDAMALPEDEDTGDRSLEEMGEGHDDVPVDEETGEDLDTGEFVDPSTMEEVDPITGQPLDAAADDSAEGATDGGEEGADQGRLPPQADQPSWLRASDQQVTAETMELRERLARAEGQLAALARPPVDPAKPGTPAQPPAIPDPVVDPEGYHRAQEDRLNTLRQEILGQIQLERDKSRLETSYANWANNYREAGREQEFYFASQTLDRMSQTGNPNDVRIVSAIVRSPDPFRAMMQWAEDNLDMDGVRERIAATKIEAVARGLDELGIDPDTVLEGRRALASDRQLGRGQQGRDPGARGGQQGRQQSRQSRLPSLNSAPGGGGRMGGNNRNLDPRGMDGSDSSIFDYAMSN